jgi:hypothetical protein
MKFPKLNFWTAVIGAFVIYIILLGILTYSNYFSRTITVKDKTNYGWGRNVSNIIMDTSGNVYTVQNMYLVGNFNAANDFSMLEVGKTYTVSGYGISVPFLQMFPNINEISPA